MTEQSYSRMELDCKSIKRNACKLNGAFNLQSNTNFKFVCSGWVFINESDTLAQLASTSCFYNLMLNDIRDTVISNNNVQEA